MCSVLSRYFPDDSRREFPTPNAGVQRAAPSLTVMIKVVRNSVNQRRHQILQRGNGLECQEECSATIAAGKPPATGLIPPQSEGENPAQRPHRVAGLHPVLRQGDRGPARQGDHHLLAAHAGGQSHKWSGRRRGRSERPGC